MIRPASPSLARSFSVADVAARLAVNQTKVCGWIARGELRAVNVADRPDGQRARWRITPEALAAFEAGCAAVPDRESPRTAPAHYRTKSNTFEEVTHGTAERTRSSNLVRA